MANFNHTKRALTEQEAATYISMSRSFLRQGRMTGRLENRAAPPPHIKIGNRSIRYLIDDLDNWLEHFKIDAEIEAANDDTQ